MDEQTRRCRVGATALFLLLALSVGCGSSEEDDYADLLAWDFSISREGTGLATEYSLRPLPAKADRAEVQKAYKEAVANGFNIKELVSGGNPFGSKG